MPERTAKSQEQMSKSCWVSAQPVLHDASGTWLRVNSSGRSEKQEISATPYMTHSIIEFPQRDHETRKSHSEPRSPRSTVGDFYAFGQCIRPPHHRSADRHLRKMEEEGLHFKRSEEIESEYTEKNDPGRDRCNQLREIRIKIAKENKKFQRSLFTSDSFPDHRIHHP